MSSFSTSPICPFCSGRGEKVSGNKFRKCSDCEGLGILTTEDDPQFFDSENMFNYGGC